MKKIFFLENKYFNDIIIGETVLVCGYSYSLIQNVREMVLSFMNSCCDNESFEIDTIQETILNNRGEKLEFFEYLKTLFETTKSCFEC